MSQDSFMVQIDWSVPGLPAAVGPFGTREEATDWGVINIPNGTWNVATLTYPCLEVGPSDADVAHRAAMHD